MHDDCEHFESFPPGHLYSSKEGGLKRWYNPIWFSEAIPSTPYDPLVLRRAFENVRFKILGYKKLKDPMGNFVSLTYQVNMFRL